MNRLNPSLDKKGYWTKQKDAVDIIKNTGFDGYKHQYKDPNSDYSQAMKYMDDPSNFNGYVKLPGFIDDLIELCLPVYHGETTDITDGSVYYYSPKAQADLHASNPGLHKQTPDFLAEDIVQVQINELSPNDDFAFYKYK